MAALFALKIGAEGAKVGKVWAGISQHAVTNSPGTVLYAAVRLQHSKSTSPDLLQLTGDTSSVPGSLHYDALYTVNDTLTDNAMLL